MARSRIGIALGGGGARGWAHIGVLQELEDMGIRPDIISGCSAGAIVGGAYAGGNLTKLADWLVSLTRREVFGFFDFSLLKGGLISGERLFDFFESHIGDDTIESLSCQFVAIATELNTGRELWLNSGSLLAATRASISIPGMFVPCQLNGKWMIDGGLVNPIPVSVCTALQADVVIAVDVNQDFNRQVRQTEPFHAEKGEATAADPPEEEPPEGGFLKIFGGHKDRSDRPDRPGLLEVVNDSIQIMQTRIARSRLMGDPPDLMLVPRVRDIGLLDFHQAETAIAQGRRCVEQNREQLKALLD